MHADVIIAMYHKIATTYAQSGVWMMNRNTLAVVRQWKDGNGRYLVLDPISAGAPSTLLGRPVVEMPDMDDIGAKIDTLSRSHDQAMKKLSIGRGNLMSRAERLRMMGAKTNKQLTLPEDDQDEV